MVTGATIMRHARKATAPDCREPARPRIAVSEELRNGRRQK